MSSPSVLREPAERSGEPRRQRVAQLFFTGEIFQNKYELCGTCAQSKRLQYAQQILAQYGGTSDTSGEGDTSTPPPPPPADTSCYSGTLAEQVPENTCVESMYDGHWYQCSQG